MKDLLGTITNLLGWVAWGLILMPGTLWLVHEYLPVPLLDLQRTGLIVFYFDFYGGLAGASSWLWVLAPYVVYLLVRPRPRPDTRRQRGYTPLGMAAFKGDMAGISGLLDRGAVINQQDRAGYTPLHLAVLNNRVDAVRRLLDAGADADVADKLSGFKPLHCSAKAGNTDVSELLIRYGADLDARSLQGETALHLAAIHGQPAVVTVLLKYLAQVGICDSHDKTPMQHAQLNGNTEIVDLIREHISDTWAYLQLANS